MELYFKLVKQKGIVWNAVNWNNIYFHKRFSVCQGIILLSTIWQWSILIACKNNKVPMVLMKVLWLGASTGCKNSTSKRKQNHDFKERISHLLRVLFNHDSLGLLIRKWSVKKYIVNNNNNNHSVRLIHLNWSKFPTALN